MEAIRVPKVEAVALHRRGTSETGTLLLTPHHLVFTSLSSSSSPDTPTAPKIKDSSEFWLPWPLVQSLNLLPQTLEGRTPLAFRTRDFGFFTLEIAEEKVAAEVFESVRDLVVVTSVYSLYAFSYENPEPPSTASPSLLPPPDETKGFGGWRVYNPRGEFARQGVGSRSRAWRFTDANRGYELCASYPSKLVVPTKISDNVLNYAAKYRSKARIPALTYLHWANFGSITRCSQPLVGLKNARSIQDEKLIESIFATHVQPDSAYSPDASATVYGATPTNLIVDARPTTNAMAQLANGAGTENMENYKGCKKIYLGIENIHVMRDSLNRVIDALRLSDPSLSSNAASSPPPLDRHHLKRSNYLKHISILLDGVLGVVRNVHINSSHVLVHCSDGWDRTSQLAALAQICLDPYFRTFKGLAVLIEKDFVSFGHRFADRCGHLSSEKFFVSAQGESGAGANGADHSGGAGRAGAFLASVQGQFSAPHHLKETSPVFLQFLDCIYQLQRQYPQRFEFNSDFLVQLHTHLYAAQYGTFLFNTERERRTVPPLDGVGRKPATQATSSVWDEFFGPGSDAVRARYANPQYDPARDDRKSDDMGVLMPDPADVRWWFGIFGRGDEEMNGPPLAQVASPPREEIVGPVESGKDDPVLATGKILSQSVSPSSSPSYAVYKPRHSPLPTSASLHFPATAPTGPPSPEPGRSGDGRERASSFRPFGTVSSAITMRPTSQVSDPVAGASGGGGYRSMFARWGSNVQDVAGKIGSQVQNLSTGLTGPAEPAVAPRGAEGELQARERPATTPAVAQAPPPLPMADNPWAATAAASVLPVRTASNPNPRRPDPPRPTASSSSLSRAALSPNTSTPSNPWDTKRVAESLPSPAPHPPPPASLDVGARPGLNEAGSWGRVADSRAVSAERSPIPSRLVDVARPRAKVSQLAVPSPSPSPYPPPPPPDKSTTDIDPLGVGFS